MGAAALVALVGLALVDSTSVGTLVIPVLMLVHPQVRPGRVVLYLATISTFYLVLGVALLLGADALTDLWSQHQSNDVVDWVQLVVGALMFGVSFWPDTPWAKRARAHREASGNPSRASRWAESISTEESGLYRVVAVALVAGLIEAASMLPYLGAVSLIASSDLSFPLRILVLVGYVAVMALPALLLLSLRLAAHNLIEPWLKRLSSWLGARAGTALWWIIRILGFLLAGDAASRLYNF